MKWFLLFILFALNPLGIPGLFAQAPPAEPLPKTDESEIPKAEEVQSDVKEALPVEAPTPPPLPTNPRELLNLLSDAQLEQATKTLQENFLNPSAMNEREMRRARLEGLLGRLGPGAEILPSKKAEKHTLRHPFLAEIIDGRVGYVRLGGVKQDDLAQLDTVLIDLADKEVEALILDLRGVPHSADFEIAADFARRFAPKGRLLFRVEKPSAKQERIFTSNQDPAFQGTLVVLTDRRTGGAAEVLAGVLRGAAEAMILGGTTAGKPVEFTAFPLGGGMEIHVAVAEAVLGENERAFPGGIAPDLEILIEPARQEELFRIASERGVSGLVFEKERPRMNEAALISNRNPEIDGSDVEEDEEGETPVRSEGQDAILQRAVDIVTALALFNR